MGKREKFHGFSVPWRNKIPGLCEGLLLYFSVFYKNFCFKLGKLPEFDVLVRKVSWSSG